MGCSRAHAHKSIENIKHEPIYCIYVYREVQGSERDYIEKILFYCRQTTPQNKGIKTAKNLLLWGNGKDGFGIPGIVKIKITIRYGLRI